MQHIFGHSGHLVFGLDGIIRLWLNRSIGDVSPLTPLACKSIFEFNFDTIIERIHAGNHE